MQADRSKLQFELHGLKNKLSKVVVKVKPLWKSNSDIKFLRVVE